MTNTKEAFISTHLELCICPKRKGKGAHDTQKRNCAIKLYKFQEKYGIPFDPAYHQKQRESDNPTSK